MFSHAEGYQGMSSCFPGQARFGVIGCATAYHLAKNGCRDVVLVEKAELTSGTTWHAAGAVAQYRSDSNAMHLAKYAIDIIPKLEAETGQMENRNFNPANCSLANVVHAGFQLGIRRRGKSQSLSIRMIYGFSRSKQIEST